MQFMVFEHLALAPIYRLCCDVFLDMPKSASNFGRPVSKLVNGTTLIFVTIADCRLSNHSLPILNVDFFFLSSLNCQNDASVVDYRCLVFSERFFVWKVCSTRNSFLLKVITSGIMKFWSYKRISSRRVLTHII